uniref:hypothetical protein n=1 Tax=Marinimicrobium locisalis TaxID=546022 RepID=UPI00322162D6
AEGGTLNNNLTFEKVATVRGGDAADTFTLSGETAFAGSIDGGANLENAEGVRPDNTLDLSAYDPAVTLTYGAGGPSWDIENINDIIGNGKTTLTLDSGTNQWALTGAETGRVTTSPGTASGGLFDRALSFSSVSALNGGSGEDTFKLTGNTAFTGAINGGGNTDTFNFTEFSTDTALDISLGNHPAATVDLASFEVLEGHTPTQGDNTLRGAAGQAHTWTIDAENEGTLKWVNNGQNFSVEFSGFGELAGGDRGDVFNVEGQGDITGTLRGGNQLDVLDFSLKEGAIELTVGQNTLGGTLSIADIESVIGHYGNEANHGSTLRVSNNSTSNTWTLTDQRQGLDAVDGVNDGVLETSDGKRLYFSNFTTLEGADHLDEFVFSGVGRMDGTLDGGGNTNTVTVTGATHALGFTLREGGDADTYLQNIDTVNASTDYVHRLVGTNEAATTWTIDGEYRGELDSGLSFSGFKHLVGGSGEDTFTLTGDGRVEHIEGGGESDTLNLQQSNHAFQ